MNFFKSIRGKIWLCISIATVGFFLTTGFAVVSNVRLKENLVGIRDHDFPLALKSTEIFNQFKKQSDLYEEGYLLGNAESVIHATGLSETILSQIEHILSVENSKNSELERIHERYVLFSEMAPEIYSILAEGVNPLRYQNEIQELKLLQNEIFEDLEDLNSRTSEMFSQNVSRIINYSDLNNAILFAFFISLLGAKIILVRYIADRLLIRPLTTLTEWVRDFGRGRAMAEPIQFVDASDEIGKLGLAFKKMTDDLQETTVSRAYLNSILKKLSDSLIVLSPDLEIVSVNRAAVKLLGYREDEIIGQHFSLISEDLPQAVFEASGEEFDFLHLWHNSEKSFITKEGKAVPVLVSGSVLTEEGENTKGLVLVAKDITAKKAAQEALRRHHRFLHTVFESISHPFSVVNVADYTISLSNLCGEEKWRKKKTTCFELAYGLDKPCTENCCPLTEVVRTRRPFQTEHACNGRTFEVHGHPIFDDDGRVVQMIEYSLEITKRKEAEQKLEQGARYDFLTGLPNRFLLNDRLEYTLASARRSGQKMGIMFIDLDRFKVINDSLGHSYGDFLLKTIAGRLSECLRESDTIGRLGGDEFAVILPSLQHDEDITGLAQRLLDALSRPVWHEGHEIFTSGSIGIAIYPQDGRNAEELLKNADAAMYKAKQSGGGEYQFFAIELNQESMERLNLERNLRNALMRDEFIVHYQLQYDLATNEVVGIEALLRWQPQGGTMVAPDAFFSLLEETGLIHPVGEFVLRTACRQHHVWLQNGYAPVRMSVNISGRQIKRDRLIEEVVQILEETEMDPRFLEFELSESTFMQNVEEIRPVLQNLKNLGISLAVDDFGTGFSSLRHLRNLPIDHIKIDRCFISTLGHQENDGAIPKAIIALANSLGLGVIAEGVETQDQFKALLKLGCHEAQGHYWGKPASADDIKPHLRVACSEKDRIHA